MKKIYLAPEIEAVEIYTTQMLCSSPLSLEGDTEVLGITIDNNGIETTEDLR